MADARQRLMELRRYDELKKKAAGITAPDVPQKKYVDPRQTKIEESYAAEQRGEQTGLETSYQAAAQAFLGPAADIIGNALTPPEAYTKGLEPITKYISSTKVGRAAESGIQKISGIYDELSPRTKRNIEATGLVTGVAPSSILGKRVLTPNKSTLAARRSNAILNDVQPGITKIRPAVEAAGHSKEIPVMGGMWKKTVETPDPFEIDAANEVAKIKGYNIKGSNLSKHNAVRGAIETEAVRLRSALKKEKFDIIEDVPENTPITKNEFGQSVQGQTIPKHTRNKFEPVLDGVHDGISRNATLTGDAKNVAADVIAKAKELMGQQPTTLEGLLNVRQELDKWARLSDKKFFDKTGARHFALREVRDAINNFIDTNAQGVAVKESLKKQSSLYRAKDVLQEKAGEDIRFKAIEAASPSTLKSRAKNVVKHGASYVGISK